MSQTTSDAMWKSRKLVMLDAPQVFSPKNHEAASEFGGGVRLNLYLDHTQQIYGICLEFYFFESVV